VNTLLVRLSKLIKSYRRIDAETVALVGSVAKQLGCSIETALKFLLKIGRCPQEHGEGDEAYAARLEHRTRNPTPGVFGRRDP
jgi:hypothetical protein